MSDSLNRRRRRNKREQQRARKQKPRGIVGGIIACALGIILVTAGVLVWNGVIHRDGPVPGEPEGLSADVCYHDVNLHWQPAKKADGYVVYMAYDEDQSAFEPVGEVDGGAVCDYEVTDYPHDQKLLFKVAAYGENFLTGNKTEGTPSQEIEAMYDSAEYAQKIPVLTYHELVPAGTEYHTSLIVPEDMFDEQMKYLKENGFRTLSLDEFYRWYQGKLEVPVKSCVITFDDGADNVYYLAYPILKKNDQSATVFCIGHHLEEDGGVTAAYTPNDGEQHRFRKDKLEELRRDYPKLACESHTYNMHKRIDGYKPVNVLSYEEMLEDIQKNAPYDFHYLAYPWGTSNKDLRKALKNSGYRLAFGYGPFRYATREDKPYNIRRIKVSGLEGMDKFIQTVNGERPDDEE